MRRFAELFEALDRTRSTLKKVAALTAYFGSADAASVAWCVWLLSGERVKRLVGSRRLRDWGREAAGLSEWLFDAAYERVGDSAETLALVAPAAAEGEAEALSLAEWMESRILALRGLDEEEQRAQVLLWWRANAPDINFLVNKLLTGALRVGVAKGLVVRALAQHSERPEALIAHRLMGAWTPSPEAYRAWLAPEGEGEERGRPYPFFLASPLEKEAAELGPIGDWQLEWKWDGIRGQLIRRQDEALLWSRGEEMVGPSFPELVAAAASLPEGTVLDGEVMAWEEGRALPFSVLQRRLGRKKPGPKIQREAPVAFLAYDLLECAGEDWRERPLTERRTRMEELLVGRDKRLVLFPPVAAQDWSEAAALREQARERGVEGLMIKARDSSYATGRKRGAWWKWKADPYVVDMVLLYAQAGSGRRANLYTDYTLAVWRDEDLVPVAKAYSGLSDQEIGELDRWIRKNTLERFGPVRSVPAAQVLEIAFEGLQRSTRHKSGLALRFPRIVRWRKDKPVEEADRIGALLALIEAEEARRERG